MPVLKPVSFRVSPYEASAIHAIAQRAHGLAASHGIHYEWKDAAMDITAVHANGCRLRLDDLARFDDFNFAHDIFGIRRHLNRTTGTLSDFFVPRSAVNT